MLGDEKTAAWTGDDRDETRGKRAKPLSPNTIEDIVNIARATLNFLLDEKIIKSSDPIAAIRVPGRTKPIDREPKGRHLSFRGTGKLVDACDFDHHLHICFSSSDAPRGAGYSWRCC